LSWFVSINRVFPLFKRLALIHSLGSDINMLLPIFCNLLAYLNGLDLY
jgi:hypothetical protein